MQIVSILKPRLISEHELRKRRWRHAALLAATVVTLIVANTLIPIKVAVAVDLLAVAFYVMMKRDLRTRLWRGGGFLAVFMATLIVANNLIPKEKAVTMDMLGYDFLAFYYGGTCIRTGHFEQLYDLPMTQAFEIKTANAAGLSLGTSFGPWWNPPFAAWMFEPLSALPFPTALRVWWTIGAFSLAGSIFLMCRMLKGGWKTRLLVPLLMLPMMPCIQAFGHGQNTFVSLLLLTITISLWRSNRSLFAGMVCGLMFYKPQLGAVVAVVLCINQGRRALLGVLLVGTALAVTTMLAMPGSLHEFVYHMPRNMQWIQEQVVYRFWERHITFKAFWRLAIQGTAVGPTTMLVRMIWGVCEIGLLGALGLLVIRTMLSAPSASRRDRLIAASLIAMPLVMPFYFDYDLLLLTVGVVVYAADRQKDSALNSDNWEDRWLVRVWVMAYLSLEITYHARVHAVVPLLAVAAVLLIRRGLRPQAAVVSEMRFDDVPLAMAA